MLSNVGFPKPFHCWQDQNLVTILCLPQLRNMKRHRSFSGVSSDPETKSEYKHRSPFNIPDSSPLSQGPEMPPFPHSLMTQEPIFPGQELTDSWFQYTKEHPAPSTIYRSSKKPREKHFYAAHWWRQSTLAPSGGGPLQGGLVAEGSF